MPDLFSQDYPREVLQAVEQMAVASAEDRGAVYTKESVVDFILDLSGYTCDEKLYLKSILEPSCGTGSFLFPIIDRLLTSWKQNGRPIPSLELKNCLRAVELHRDTYQELKQQVLELLINNEIPEVTAQQICDHWFIQGDFLLTDELTSFDYVVGNPPYLRQEKIAPALLAAYRAKYTTLYDRADLYIPFFERSLNLLKPNGILGFICTDRWTKNKYGGPLRKMISDRFSLLTYVDLYGKQAFESEVSAYPAIMIISRSKQSQTALIERPELSKASLSHIVKSLTTAKNQELKKIKFLNTVCTNESPWLLGGEKKFELVRRLEKQFLPIEAAGCKVGIGVATGADKVFIQPVVELAVEDSRKLPIVGTQDISGGELHWRGKCIVNPFEADGSLVDLEKYPKLTYFLQAHREQLIARHVAKKNPANWYRTIDKIHAGLVYRKKLLIPDIKGGASIVYDDGHFYPHHNLYYIISSSWDLRALQTLLLSGIAHLFVSTYSTKIRGGYLRYQAQYLRKIRVPLWHTVSDSTKKALIAASENLDFVSCKELVFDLYNMSSSEREMLNAQQMT